MGYSPWGHKESDTTEWLDFTQVVTLFFRHNAIAHFIAIVLCEHNFYKHWETKKCVTPFDICSIPVVWN